MKTFDVLTVSSRTGWESIAEDSIKRQTVQPESWVIVSEQPLTLRYWRAPKAKRLSNLNASLNEGLRRVKSDYVIFYQDFIELRKDCFEKLIELATPKTFVTTCTPNYDGSDDIRYTGTNNPRPCRPEEWESNVSIAPMAMIKKLGGFDEEYDWGWSWDNVNLAERAAMLGAKFICDESNRPKLYSHEMESRADLPLNIQRHQRTMREIRMGKRSLKNKYL